MPLDNVRMVQVERRPSPCQSILRTVLGTASVAIAVFSTIAFVATGGLMALGCALASGLLAVIALSGCHDDEGVQQRASRVVHVFHRTVSPTPPVFSMPIPVRAVPPLAPFSPPETRVLVGNLSDTTGRRASVEERVFVGNLPAGLPTRQRANAQPTNAETRVPVERK